MARLRGAVSRSGGRASESGPRAAAGYTPVPRVASCSQPPSGVRDAWPARHKGLGSLPSGGTPEIRRVRPNGTTRRSPDSLPSAGQTLSTRELGVRRRTESESGCRPRQRAILLRKGRIPFPPRASGDEGSPGTRHRRLGFVERRFRGSPSGGPTGLSGAVPTHLPRRRRSATSRRARSRGPKVVRRRGHRTESKCGGGGPAGGRRRSRHARRRAIVRRKGRFQFVTALGA